MPFLFVSFTEHPKALPSQPRASPLKKIVLYPLISDDRPSATILSLLKHYNAGTRKDAIFSARELFQDHPGLLERSIAPLLSVCVRLVGDEVCLQPRPSCLLDAATIDRMPVFVKRCSHSSTGSCPVLRK
ncbi:hypothetical protein JVT61DRAFT_5647 [Boletus reticuloceps]|uniref:Uncharacterized protein n=1 Tax=Boletus reticuloceps TaxID=495285 RepID=A0A8I3AF91_9AGAM|nr:hypothetical protein JVT61DRAFT_5647 [Boletus reticuloceps]